MSERDKQTRQRDGTMSEQDVQIELAVQRQRINELEKVVDTLVPQKEHTYMMEGLHRDITDIQARLAVLHDKLSMAEEKRLSERLTEEKGRFVRLVSFIGLAITTLISIGTTIILSLIHR